MPQNSCHQICITKGLYRPSNLYLNQNQLVQNHWRDVTSPGSRELAHSPTKHCFTSLLASAGRRGAVGQPAFPCRNRDTFCKRCGDE